MPYHVRLKFKSTNKNELILLDRTKEWINERIVQPYRQGTSIVCKGKPIPVSELESIHINYTNESSTSLIPYVGMTMAFSQNPKPQEWYITQKGEDVTDEFITTPPGVDSQINYEEPETRTANKNIFIVHGQDETVKAKVTEFIRRIKLEPIILHEQLNEGKTIIEKLDKYSKVGFAIVLLTPDEKFPINGARIERARQNVIFELGYFIGKIGREKVCALYKKPVELPSDYKGVVYVELDDYGAWERKVAKEIKATGIPVDLNNL